MQMNVKSAGIIAAVTIAAVAGGIYLIKSKHTPMATQEVAGQPSSSGSLPPGHPPVNRDGQGKLSAPADGMMAQPASQPNSQREQLSGSTPENPSARFTHFRIGDGNAKSIYIDGDTVWVGTSGGAIRYSTKTDQFRIFDQRDGLLSRGIFYIGKIDGRITVGTYGGGMSIYNPATDKWENYNIPNGLADAFVYKVLQASNGDVWIATWSGANRIRGGDLKDRSKWDVYTVENTKGGLPNDWVYSLHEGKDGDIWVATEGGPARFRNGKWQNWNHKTGVGADYEKIKNDPQFGTDPAKFSSHHAQQKKEMGLQGINVAYNPNYIVSMTVDKNGEVWCGTWGAGLAHYDGKKWHNYTMSDGLPGNHIFMLHQDPNGSLWVGTNNGVAIMENDKLDKKTIKVLTTNDGLFSNTVFSMATAPDGSKWFGSFGGVTHLR